MAKPYYSHTNLGIAMVKKHVSVNDLSFDTRIATRTLGYYLRGEKAMSPDHLRTIAQSLDVDPRDIWQPILILQDITPHADHRASAATPVTFRHFPHQE